MKISARYLSILLGLFYCLFILWNRLLRKRNPIDLFTEYTTFRIVVYSCLCILSLLLVVHYLRKLLDIQPKLNFLKGIVEKPWFITLSIIIQEYVLQAPKNLYEWLYERIKIRPFIEQCCGFMHEFTLHKNKYLMITVILFMATFRIIVCLFFVYGVFLLHNLIFFYKSLIFLLIPMLFNLLLFSIDHLAKINKAYIASFILFEGNETRDGWIISRKDENDLELTEEIMDYHAEMWFAYLYAIMTIDTYHTLENKVKPYIYIFCYSLYAFGWGYILYHIYLKRL
jgi:hypothetical protein